jgi:hypothetical protein
VVARLAPFVHTLADDVRLLSGLLYPIALSVERPTGHQDKKAGGASPLLIMSIMMILMMMKR